MQQLIEITGNVSLGQPISLLGKVRCSKPMVITGNLILGSDRKHDTYDGDYVVIPKVYDQILDTDDKLMADDVTVKEITYSETTNIQGGLTVQIGEV